MKYSILLVLFVLVGCLEKGFHEKSVYQSSYSVFEPLPHYNYCFYNDIQLSKCSYLSVDPSNQLALIQESRSGDLYVYNAKSKQKIWLTDQFIGLVEMVVWHSNSQSVTVTIDKLPTIFSIK